MRSALLVFCSSPLPGWPLAGFSPRQANPVTPTNPKKDRRQAVFLFAPQGVKPQA